MSKIVIIQRPGKCPYNLDDLCSNLISEVVHCPDWEKDFPEKCPLENSAQSDKDSIRFTV